MAKKLSLAVLPIPNVVFYPHTALPVYVTEPVYVRMIRECIDSGQLLAVSLAEPVDPMSPKTKYHPKDICGVGRPLLLEENSDGSIKILIRGITRARLGNVTQNLPYLIFEAEELNDVAESFTFNQEDVSRLSEILTRWLGRNIVDSVDRDTFLQSLSSVYHVVDYTCMFLIHNPEMRQMLLESQSLAERIQVLNSLLQGEDPWQEDPSVVQALKVYETIEYTSAVAH